MSFITDEVKTKRAADINDRRKTLETLRRNEVSRFLEEGIPTLCEEARKAAINEYLMKGKLPDEICVYDHDRLITQAVANSHSCRKALLEKLQSLEEKIRDVEFSYTESNPWVATTDPYIVVYFSNNQE
ncbi:MAG: hypothetical protein HXL02_03150 [Candidatus Nanosynbacter sp.]|nr:hypothetical protein [Candidatus Nanosynbacter sp.]